MSDSRVLVGVLLVVAVLPFLLLAAVRLAVRAVPAQFGWLGEFERRHYSGYWLFVATMYELIGVGHLALKDEAIRGILFLALGVTTTVSTLWRRRHVTP